jgi:hypothetical protein
MDQTLKTSRHCYIVAGMIRILFALVSLLSFRLRSRAALGLEFIALRHRATVLRRQRPGQRRLLSITLVQKSRQALRIR